MGSFIWLIQCLVAILALSMLIAQMFGGGVDPIVLVASHAMLAILSLWAIQDTIS